MKKVLLGLLAMSAVSMAAATDLTKPTVEGTDVFSQLQQGRIAVTGTITSEVPLIKYVVFASENGTTREDVWALPNYVLSPLKASSEGFQGTLPKVYVKRVEGGQISELTDRDVVEFKVKVDERYTRVAKDWLKAGSKKSLPVTAMLSHKSLENMMVGTSIPGLFPDSRGILTHSAGGTHYDFRPAYSLAFTSTSNGVLEVSTEGNAFQARSLNDGETGEVLAKFAGGKPIANAEVLVRIK